MAAPIGSQVLGEVLPYLEVQKDNVADEDKKEELEVPNIIGMTISEAKKELENVGLGTTYEETESDDSNRIITNQVPIGGIEVYEGTNIIAEYEQ